MQEEGNGYSRRNYYNNNNESSSNNSTNINSSEEIKKQLDKKNSFKQVRLRKSTYHELVSLGIVPESIDSIVRRAIKIAGPVMRKTQASIYNDLASEVTGPAILIARLTIESILSGTIPSDTNSW